MLPKTAIPIAPPSSAEVSAIAEAAPARSGGATPTIRSIARVNTGARPSEKTTDPDRNVQNPEDPSSVRKTANPPAAIRNPAAINPAGGNRRASRGVSCDPTTNASAHGKVQSPA